MKRILFLRTPDDAPYITRFKRLPSTQGAKLFELETRCSNTAQISALCEKNKIDAVMTTQQSFLEAALDMSLDYIPPPENKRPSLNDYAGSILDLRCGRELLVLNPLERLRTVAEERFVVGRYVRKLTNPDSWPEAIPFHWRIGTEEDIERIASASFIAVDIETVRNHPDRIMSCVGYGCYFADTNTIENYVYPVNDMADLYLIRRINKLDPPKLTQGGLYDTAYFMRWGCPLYNWSYDTLVLFHCWLAELPKRLDFISSFALRKIRFWKDDGKTGNLQDHYRYNARDCWATACSWISLLQECPPWVLNNYRQEFMTLFPALHASMEGLNRDEERFKEVAASEAESQSKTLTRIRRLLGSPGFNPNSPPQTVELIKMLGEKDVKSSDKITVQKVSAKHPLNDFILRMVGDYRSALKVSSTYLRDDSFWNNRLLYKIDPSATDSGRCNSSESQFWTGYQIQNIPGDPKSVKSFLKAPDGWYIAECDKKQSEARCVGYLSGDKNLIDLVESPHDYHAWNAAAFFGIPYETIYDESVGKTINKVIRDLSKRTNHGANYNMGAGVLLDTMGPKAVAQAKVTLNLPQHWLLKQVTEYLLKQYDRTYPTVRGPYYQKLITDVVTKQMLVSPLGWRRICFGDMSRKPDLNSVVAHPSQNLSVAIVNKEWYIVWRATVYGGELEDRVRIVAQIHDSLLFFYKELAAAQRVQELMMYPVNVTDIKGVTRRFVIPTDLSTGKSPTQYWGDLK